MSKYIPAARVQQEQIMQSVRLINGLKQGTYVRCRVGKRVGTALKHKAEKEGWTILTEAEFQDAIKSRTKEESKND